ncbi:MAG: TauD/TfdA family dioxygenase [Cystobacter sp.]
MIVKPLSDVLGAEVVGVDLSKPLEKNTVDELRRLFAQHQVLVFRDQKLEAHEQIAACKQFGEIEPHPLKNNTQEFTEMTVVSNVFVDGKPLGFLGPPFELWHSDLCYLEKPAKMTFLYAHTIPEKNGDTWFADMRKAYEDLPEDVKKKIDGRLAVFGLNQNLVTRCQAKGWPMFIADEDVKPDVLHPVVRTHPENGRRSLFINWAHTDRIEGYSEEESQALLDQLFTHSREERYIYRHAYRPGDVICWDNASTLHTNCPEYPEGDRIMMRVVIKGEAPFYKA